MSGKQKAIAGIGAVVIIAVILAVAALAYGAVVWLLLWATNKYLSWPSTPTAYYPDCVVLGIVFAVVSSVFFRRGKD